MDCLFCKIISGEVKSYKVFEDDLVIAFLDIKPLSEGHTLIIPKKHSKDITDIDNESLVRITLTTKQLANTYIEKLNSKGFNIRNSSGAIAHQDVFHFHMHLIPRYENDGLNLVASHSYNDIDINKVFEKIKS